MNTEQDGNKREVVLKTEYEGDTLVVVLPARLDAVGVAAIENQFGGIMADNRGKFLLVDMSQTNFVASLALRMLLTNHKDMAASGGDWWLVGLQSQIAEVFRKSNFDTMFTIYPDRATALDALNKG